ncbi:MAG TPA: GNAT family N-acetyltransferase [Vicinamibacterales bacterium]|nr:GNAT family N-acetyltransferase [Vicinamibacterales bacterium]
MVGGSIALEPVLLFLAILLAVVWWIDKRKPGITVRREDLASPAVQTLIEALNADLRARYPEGDGMHYFRLDAEEVRPGRGAFVVAYDADVPLGCGAVRTIGAGVAEVKRMYVVPGARGRGVARRMLEILESEARAIGVTTLMLETGTRQPEAIALYSKTGYARRGAFGDYPPSPMNVFFEKHL